MIKILVFSLMLSCGINKNAGEKRSIKETKFINGKNYKIILDEESSRYLFWEMCINSIKNEYNSGKDLEDIKNEFLIQIQGKKLKNTLNKAKDLDKVIDALKPILLSSKDEELKKIINELKEDTNKNDKKLRIKIENNEILFSNDTSKSYYEKIGTLKDSLNAEFETGFEHFRFKDGYFYFFGIRVELKEIK